MIYSKLPKPFFVLAPMDDVTDTVFRQIVVSTAPADLFFTEFVNGYLQSSGNAYGQRTSPAGCSDRRATDHQRSAYRLLNFKHANAQRLSRTL